MIGRTLNIYVDESGNFNDIEDNARFCIITFVLSEDGEGNRLALAQYKNGIYLNGADPDSMVFHSGPLIRQEEQFSAMSQIVAKTI